MNEKALLTKLLEGSEDSFVALVSQHHHYLIRIASTLLPHAQAEEVVQDAWLKVVDKLALFDGKASLKTWLVRIVINTAKDRLKSKLNLEIPSEFVTDINFNAKGGWVSPPSNWHIDNPEDLLIQEEVKSIILNTIQNLPDNQRQVITLYDFENIALKLICNILDLSSSNMRVLLHRARCAVYSAVDDYLK